MNPSPTLGTPLEPSQGAGVAAGLGGTDKSPRSSGPVPTLGAAFEVSSNSQSTGTEQWREALAHSALPLCSKRIV